MAKRTFLAGATSQTIDIFIMDSSSTAGAGLSGLVFNSSGLKCYYRKGATGSATAVTLATQTVGGAWSSGGFVEIDATNMKGVYRFDIPDTVLASTPWATLYFYGATNMAPVVAEVEIVSYNPFDGTRLGLTALPNAAAGANGGLPLSVDASGRVDVLKINGTSQTARDIGASVLLSAGTGTGQLDFTSGVVKANATQWLSGTIPAVNVTGVPLVDLKYTLGTISPATAGSVRADSVTGAVGSVTAGVTVTTNNDKTGYALSSAGVQAIWDALTSALTTVGSIGKLIVDNLNATITSRMATYTQPTGFLAATFPGTVASTTNITAASGVALTAAYDPAKTAAQAGDAMALTAGERNSTADAFLNRDMSTGTDSGSATVRTVRQALRMNRNKVAISAGTMTVYKEDDATASWTSAITTTAGNPVTASDPAGP